MPPALPCVHAPWTAPMRARFAPVAVSLPSKRVDTPVAAPVAAPVAVSAAPVAAPVAAPAVVVVVADPIGPRTSHGCFTQAEHESACIAAWHANVNGAYGADKRTKGPITKGRTITLAQRASQTRVYFGHNRLYVPRSI